MPSLGSEHPTDPGTLSEGSSVPLHSAPPSPHRASSPLCCSPGSFGLTARWQSATTVMGKVPSGMHPRLGLLAGTYTCSQLLCVPPQTFPSPRKPDSPLVFLSIVKKPNYCTSSGVSISPRKKCPGHRPCPPCMLRSCCFIISQPSQTKSL